MYHKQALTIGINSYTPKRLSLKPCINDANDLSASLQSVGFQVKNVVDADLRTIRAATHQFVKSIQPGAVVVFYFSGHGVQSDGNNYLIPSDALGICADNIRSTAIDAQQLIDAMYERKPKLIVCILDCCRTSAPDAPIDANPWKRALAGTRPGLAPMQAPPSTIVVYACAANDVASPRSKNGRNSLYTYYLLKHMRTPNVDVETLLKRVAVDVQRESNNEQIPYRYSSCNEVIYIIDQQEPRRHIQPQPQPLPQNLHIKRPVQQLDRYQDNRVIIPMPHILNPPQPPRPAQVYMPNRQSVLQLKNPPIVMRNQTGLQYIRPSRDMQLQQNVYLVRHH